MVNYVREAIFGPIVREVLVDQPIFLLQLLHQFSARKGDKYSDLYNVDTGMNQELGQFFIVGGGLVIVTDDKCTIHSDPMFVEVFYHFFVILHPELEVDTFLHVL